MHALSRPTPRLATLLLALLAPACDTAAGNLGGSPQDRAEAANAIASLELTAIEAALLTTIAEATPLGVSANAMASTLATAAPTLFTPATCVNAEALGTTTTLTFQGCSGPRGLRNLRGLVNVAFTAEVSTSVAISLTATDLATGRGNAILNATGDYTVTNQKPRLTMITSGGGVATGSRPMTRAGTYTTTWEPDDCLLLDGQWTTTLDFDLRATGVQNYKRCGLACPTSGTLAYAAIDDVTTTVDPFATAAMVILFRGNRSAAFTSSRGTLGTLALDCAQ
jgi:hypothetical protein